MNLKEALDILRTRSRSGWDIRPTKDKKKFDFYFSDGDFYKTLEAREVISWARCWTSDNKQNTTHKGLAKEFRHRKNRAAERNAIASQDFDKLPVGKGRRALAADDDI